MPQFVKHLLIGSTEAYSGKSAAILGIADQLQKKGLKIAYGKPIGGSTSEAIASDEPTTPLDEDVQFLTETLQLSAAQVIPPLVFLNNDTISKRLTGDDPIDYSQLLQTYRQVDGVDLVLMEGAGTLQEGQLFNLSLPQVAEAVDAAVILVCRFHSGLLVDNLITAQKQLGDRLIGVLINDISPEVADMVKSQVKPFLEHQGIAVLGMLPQDNVLRSVSVRELVRQLKAQVLCRNDRLDLMVESLKIGAMNVNSALKYFRRGHNMAVVTGGDRTDIQLAALETSTHCLILTGQIPPTDAILSRAEDLEIPILSVDLDTLTTVEIIDQTFGQVRLHEPIKVQCVKQLMEQHFETDLVLSKLQMN